MRIELAEGHFGVRLEGNGFEVVDTLIYKDLRDLPIFRHSVVMEWTLPLANFASNGR